MSEPFEGISELKRNYKRALPNSFGLYLGAGINLSTENVRNPRYPTHGWAGLLQALYQWNKDRLTASVAQLWEKYQLQEGYDWLGLATELRGSLPVETFIAQIDEILYDGIPRGDKDARLSRRFLEQAPSLHAALCFSTRIRSRTATSWTFARNPKIAVVITSNYDFFFGAGWTRYEAFKKQWKVRTHLSDPRLACEPGTINYIHGYIPYSRAQKQEIVLTRESYEEAYAEGGFARRALWKGINEYHLIFLGTSFTDLPLRQMLKAHKRHHYAIVTPDLAGMASELGITPVVVPRYSDIAVALKEIYCAALDSAECRTLGLENPEGYWQRLCAGKRRTTSL